MPQLTAQHSSKRSGIHEKWRGWNPSADVLAHMVSASRHAHWLNPEPKHLWGSGDSAVPRYSDLITMHECRSAKQLAAVIDQLLPV